MSNKTNIEEDIDICKNIIKQNNEIVKQTRKNKDTNAMQLTANCDRESKAIENILADRERLEKENQESIPYHILYDFLITSVDETQKPIWTEEHINELLDNFIIKWKEKI